jgi:calcium-dependent protein kinase
MHIDKNMVHRDIKLENLLVQPDSSGPNGEIKIKLTDFGFATYVKVGEKMDLPLGSPLYMAPQIVARKDYSRKCDTWAIGVMTYIMLSGAPPFYDKNTNRLNRYICKKPVAFPDTYFKNISQDARDFIIKCLKKDEAVRPEIAEMLEHPWIKTIFERDVNEKVKIDICANLNNFKKADVFQSGVMSIITNLMTTATELDELDRMFMKFDSNNDGTLSPEEIREGMTEVLGLFEAEQMDWDHFFNQVDGNKDGKIDHTEFITAALNRAKMLSQNNVNNIFDMFDANSDGYIDLDELKAVF